jgi:uncharacterized protein (DUF1684 family)
MLSDMSSLPDGDLLSLLDYRRRVSELYARIRASPEPEPAWREWRRTRDELFSTHPQSPVAPERRSEAGPLDYFDYDPDMRALARVRPADPEDFDIPTSGTEPMSFTRFATAGFALGDGDLELELYWLHGYGGGIFLPFHDATSGKDTYGAGRYLLDTVKGADLGVQGDRLVLDFNFAYNPSCSYDPRWVCPLAPPPNRLEVAVRAGERTGACP